MLYKFFAISTFHTPQFGLKTLNKYKKLDKVGLYQSPRGTLDLTVLCSKPPASKTSIKQCFRGTLDLAAPSSKLPTSGASRLSFLFQGQSLRHATKETRLFKNSQKWKQRKKTACCQHYVFEVVGKNNQIAHFQKKHQTDIVHRIVQF